MIITTKIVNIALIVIMLIGMFLNAVSSHGQEISQSGAALSLLLLFSLTLYFLIKGGNNKFRVFLIIFNTVFGLLIYIPFILFMLNKPFGQISLWQPFAVALIFLPFALNILALLKSKKLIATIPTNEG